MTTPSKRSLLTAGLVGTLATTAAFAGTEPPTLPGPGIFALLALGVVGAIGIAKLRK